MVEEPIEYKTKGLKREITPIIRILEDPESEEKSIAQIADEIISAIDEVRSSYSQVCIVARVSYDGGDTWEFFVGGPYKSRAIAKSKGESLNVPGGKYVCKWLIFDMSKDMKALLKAAEPVEEGQSAWTKEVHLRQVLETRWIEPLHPPEDEDGQEPEVPVQEG